MLETLMNANLLFEAETTLSSLRQSHLERALDYRIKIYPIIDHYFNPQNTSPKAKSLQTQFNQIVEKDFFYAKHLKAKLLDEFIDEIFLDPKIYGLSFEFPPSVSDKLWTKTILIHDFIYYGPTTILSICNILKKYEDISSNPLYLLLESNIDYKQITEIRVNNYQEIYYEARSKVHKWDLPFLSNNHLINIIERIISENNSLKNAGVSINNSSPIADFEHPCGYIRGSAIIPPAAEAPFLTLRIHPGRPYNLDELVDLGMLSSEMQEFLIAAQEAGTTIAIAGTMGSGKTTLLSALAEHWPSNKGRKATIEDTPELRPQINDLVKMRTLEYERDNLKSIDVTKLTKACKRHSVRYVVLSEARDGSAWEILQLSQAILGTLMTFHYTLRSNRHLVDQALNTLVALCKQHPLAPQNNDIKYLIADMVQILILVEQNLSDNIRRIIKIYYITGFDEMNKGHFKAIELFAYDNDKGFFRVNLCVEFEDYLRSKGVVYQC